MNDRDRQDDAAKHMWEALDACRHDHPEDLELPEVRAIAEQLRSNERLQAEYEQMRKLDSRLERALSEVSVPAGLGDRLAAALARSTPPVVVGGAMGVVRDPDVDVETTQRRLAGDALERLRGRWAVAALATAAALFLIVWFSWPASQYTQDRVLAFGQQYYSDDAEVGSGKLLAEFAPPGSLAISSVILARAPMTRWREVEGFLGRRGVAYDLVGVRGSSATLYVVPFKGAPKSPKIVGDLPLAPRAQPASSGGLPAEAWVESGRLYVLVVNGGQQDYRQFLRGAGTLT